MAERSGRKNMCIGFSGMEVTGSFGQPHQLSCDGVGEGVREVRADSCFKCEEESKEKSVSSQEKE